MSAFLILGYIGGLLKYTLVVLAICACIKYLKSNKE